MIPKIKGGMFIISIVFLFEIILFGCTPPKLRLEQNVPDNYFSSNSKVDLKVQLLIEDSMVTSSFDNIRAGVSISITDSVINGIKQMADSVFSEVAISKTEILPNMDAFLMPKVLYSTVREDAGYNKMNMSVAVGWFLVNSSKKMIWFDIVTVSKSAPSTWVAPTAIKRMKSLSLEVLGEVFSETASILRSSKRVLAYAENRYIAPSDYDSIHSKMNHYKAEITTEEEFKNDNWAFSDLELGKIAIIGCERTNKYSIYELGIVSERTFHLLNNNLKEEYQKCLDINAPEAPIVVKVRNGEVEFSTDRQVVKFKTPKKIFEYISSKKEDTKFKHKSNLIVSKLLCTLNFNENLFQWSKCE